MYNLRLVNLAKHEQNSQRHEYHATCPHIYHQNFKPLSPNLWWEISYHCKHYRTTWERERLHERETKGDGCQWLPIWKNVKPWPNLIVNRTNPPSQIFIYEYDFKNQLLIDHAIRLKTHQITYGPKIAYWATQTMNRSDIYICMYVFY